MDALSVWPHFNSSYSDLAKMPTEPYFDSQKHCSPKHLQQLLFCWQKWKHCSFIWLCQPVLTQCYVDVHLHLSVVLESH